MKEYVAGKEKIDSGECWRAGRHYSREVRRGSEKKTQLYSCREHGKEEKNGMQK